MSYQPLADGDLAAVVTYLEMRERPNMIVPPSELRLRRDQNPDPATYRALFRRVGGPWLWFSRLIMNDADLSRIIKDPGVELFVIEDEGGTEAGMLELDFRERGECELAFIGLVSGLAGKGHGRWLLAKAVELAWREGVNRVHVHTCSLDHPAALPAYIRAGFKPFRRAVEYFPDPRLLSILPEDCAPQIPLFGTPT